MAKLTAIATLLALCVLWPKPGQAAPDDVATLRAELEALKTDYATRVQALETRIRQLESTVAAQSTAAGAPAAAAVPAPPIAPAEAAPVALPGGGKGGAAAFNPAMSVILSGNYASLSQDPATYRIAGFIPPPGGTGPGERGFNLDESELTVSSNVDPYFFANLTAAISGDDSIDVEEAYFRTIALSNGFTAKGGRFFSALGYLNEIHSHAWDFVDQPLVYQAFFGSQLAQDGLQVKWIAPTVTFIELGAETGNGRDFPGTHRDSNGMNSNLLFGHVGGDVGDSTSWRTGLSWLDARAENRAYEDVDQSGVPVANAFTGTSKTWIVDGTLKWAPHGDPTVHQLKLQGEYMHRTEDGQLAFDTTGANLSDSYSSTQSGWYVQGVYEFRPRWRAGLRYDSMDSGTPHIGLVESGRLSAAAFPVLQSASPERTTVMIDWSPSEFSRLRAQYAWDDARASQRDRQFLLQYLFGIGAHGAHKF
jgi:hypothetical protein